MGQCGRTGEAHAPNLPRPAQSWKVHWACMHLRHASRSMDADESKSSDVDRLKNGPVVHISEIRARRSGACQGSSSGPSWRSGVTWTTGNGGSWASRWGRRARSLRRSRSAWPGGQCRGSPGLPPTRLLVASWRRGGRRCGAWLRDGSGRHDICHLGAARCRLLLVLHQSPTNSGILGRLSLTRKSSPMKQRSAAVGAALAGFVVNLRVRKSIVSTATAQCRPRASRLRLPSAWGPPWAHAEVRP